MRVGLMHVTTQQLLPRSKSYKTNTKLSTYTRVNRAAHATQFSSPWLSDWSVPSDCACLSLAVRHAWLHRWRQAVTWSGDTTTTVGGSEKIMDYATNRWL